jgi:membrane peptidoglycan carboxypeptidase
VVGVWVGNDDNSPMKGVTGGTLPAEIWRDFMAKAIGRAPVGEAVKGEPVPEEPPLSEDTPVAEGGAAEPEAELEVARARPMRSAWRKRAAPIRGLRKRWPKPPRRQQRRPRRQSRCKRRPPLRRAGRQLCGPHPILRCRNAPPRASGREGTRQTAAADGRAARRSAAPRRPAHG